MGLFRNSRELEFRTSKPLQKPGLTNKGEGKMLLCREKKKGSWKVLFGMKVHWRKMRVQGGDDFSLVELLG